MKQCKNRACILGYPVDIINMKDAVDFAENCIKSSNSAHVVTLNPEMIMQGIKNPELDKILKKAELIVPDGIGIIISLDYLGVKNIKQLPGIEFSYNLIQKCVEQGYKIGFLGASKEVIDKMTAKFKSKFPAINIVFVHDGYFTNEKESEIIEEIKSSQLQVLFVALGVPRQELWIDRHRDILGSVLMVGVGGSFDVWSNKVKRAPSRFRELGLEWFYRLITQPSRFSRMFPTLPLFFIKVLFDRKNTRKEY